MVDLARTVIGGRQPMVRGPRPIRDIYAFHPLEMCDHCIWICEGRMHWYLKFVNRVCQTHAPYITPWSAHYG